MMRSKRSVIGEETRDHFRRCHLQLLSRRASSGAPAFAAKRKMRMGLLRFAIVTQLETNGGIALCAHIPAH
jgi:hypothetical protein